MRFRELPLENPASQQPAAEDHQHDRGQEHGRVVDKVHDVVLGQVLQVLDGHREVEVGHVVLSHIGHHKVEVGLDVIFFRSPLAQGCIGSNPVGLANLILTLGANIHLGCFA